MSPSTSFRVYTLLTIVRPDLSLFALQCINLEGQRGKGPSSPRLPGSSALSDLSVSSHPSAFTFPGDGTVVSEHGPDVYERTYYYNGIAGHDVIQEILALLRKNGVEDIVVEWHEAAPARRLVDKITFS